MIDLLRNKKPKIQNITNYVTANDVANAIIAIGGSPLMAEAYEEMEDIVPAMDGLNINIGMINSTKYQAILKAFETALKYHIPVVLDPVGIGISNYRKSLVNEMLKIGSFTVIKGNDSEIYALVKGQHKGYGVDSEEVFDTLQKKAEFALDAAKILACKIVMTGKEDIVSDGNKAYIIKNGDAMMTKITGTGCILNGLLTAFAATENTLESIRDCVMAEGIAGQRAAIKAQGTGTFRMYFLDELYKINDEDLEKEGYYETIKR